MRQRVIKQLRVRRRKFIDIADNARGEHQLASAMSKDASKLFSVVLKAPEHAIGTDTIECIQSGVILGAAAMLDGLADRMADELDGDPTLIITGGLARYIVGSCRRNFILDDDIIFRGMARYYELNAN